MSRFLTIIVELSYNLFYIYTVDEQKQRKGGHIGPPLPIIIGMVCRKNILFLMIVCLTLATAASSHAGITLNRFSITPYVGGYTFDSKISLVRQTNPVWGIKLGYDLTERWSLSSLNMINTAGGQDNVYQYLIQLDALYHLRTDQAFIPFLAAGGGAVSFHPDSKMTGRNLFFDYGIGAKYFLKDHLAINGDVRHLLLFNNGDHDRNDFEYQIGLTWYWSGKRPKNPPSDRDRDGVPDDQDQCPKTPFDIGVDVNGCPVLDKSSLDSDGDSVTDDQDRCPGTPFDINIDANGCPVLDKSSLDSDGDGVTDDTDICPGTPVGKTVDARGCLLASLPLPEEEILEIPPAKPIEDEIPVPEERQAKEPAIAKTLEQPPPIQFDFDSTAIRPEYEEALRSLAEFLNETPDLYAFIEGHTDSIGTEEYNIVLSQQRADRVMNRLITFNVDPLRLTALGYGEGRLISENSTNENRQMNRRVQIILSDRKRIP